MLKLEAKTNPRLFTTEATKHDDLLWVGEYPDGEPAVGLVQIIFNDPSLMAGGIAVDEATRTARSAKNEGEPFARLGPLLVLHYDHGDLDVSDAFAALQDGTGIKIITDAMRLHDPIDVTQEVGQVMTSADRRLQLAFAYAGRVDTDGRKHRIDMRPEDARWEPRLRRRR